MRAARAFRRLRGLGRVALLGLFVLAMSIAPLQAQDQVQKPVMENVFFNVVWGSAFGATLGVAAAVLASSDKSSPEDVREGAFTGATAGGLLGLGIGLYLVYQGITFDPGTSSFGAQNGRAPSPAIVHAELAPITLLTAPGHPGKVVGFAARVINFRF